MGKREVRRDELWTNLLLVEGKDDKHVISNLLKRYDILVPDLLEIKHPTDYDPNGVEGGGISRLLNIFEVKLTQALGGRLGIIVDADTDLSGRWKSLHDILNSSGYNRVPKKPISGGTVIRQEKKPIVGIWLMPDNTIHGMLEDFVGYLRPQDDLFWSMAVEVVQKVKTVEHERRFHNDHESKAKIHTWLAWQKEPGTPMGQAITARYLDADAPHALKLISWIRDLFELESV